MRLLAPESLHYLWLALVPLVLWLFKRQARRVPVSTLLFFRTLAKEHTESAWLRRWKKWLSLLLTLLVMLAAVLALSRPSRESAEGMPGSVVIVVDVSASMGAQEGSTSVLARAQSLARARVRGLPESTIVSLIAFAAQPQVLLSRSRNHREFIRLLDGLRDVPMEGDEDAALASARRLAAVDSDSQVWWFSDQAPKAKDVQPNLVALASPMNVGLTGFHVRKAPLSRERYEGFVRVSAAMANARAAAVTLEVRMDGRAAQLRELELAPGEDANLILPLEGVKGQTVELQFKCPGDGLAWDDALIAPLPKAEPLVVAWVSETPDAFTEVAMTSLVDQGHVQVLRAKPSDWPLKVKPDVLVLEGWLPEQWPAEVPVIALQPVRSCGALSVTALPSGVPVDEVRAVNAEHPVLFRVNAARLSLTQSSRVSSPALETLWAGGTEPLLMAGEINGQRAVVAAFSPQRSEQLALLPAFPLLLGNALYWCAEGGDAVRDDRPLRTGEVLRTPGTLSWQWWNGTRFVSDKEEPASALLAMSRIGMWTDAKGQSGASVLSSLAETNVPKAAPEQTSLTLPRVAGAWSWPQRMLWIVVMLLLLESYLCHRRAVY